MRVIYRERISADRRNPHPLGRHVHHDSESRRYPFRVTGRTLAYVRWVRGVTVWDQANVGSCTCEAGLGVLAYPPFFTTLRDDWTYKLTQVDAYKLYRAVTRVDPYPGEWEPDDTGSDGLSVAKVLHGAGQIAGYLTPFGADAVLEALQTSPLITGTNWYSGMFSPDLDGLVRPTGYLAGGHEYIVDEYQPDTGRVGFCNSWGSSWGQGGRFYMTVADYARLLGEQGDATLFIRASDPAPTPTPSPDELADRTFAGALRPWIQRRHCCSNKLLVPYAHEWLMRKGLMDG